MEYKRDLQLLLDSSYFKELSNFYTNESILDIVGVSRLERVHSNFLYWLLDIEGSHKLKDRPFRSFLFSCVGQKWRMVGNYELVDDINYIFPKDWTDMFLLYENKYDIVDYKIYKEFYIKEAGRVDLLISCKLVVHKEYEKDVSEKELDLLFVIENKIDCSENDNQTEKYQDYFDNVDEEFKDKKKIYIYLIPDVDVNKPHNKNFLPFQYQDLINMTITKCLDVPMLEETKSILNSYLRCLTFPSNKENSIVAITDREINIVNKLWENYSAGLHDVIMQQDDQSKIIYEINKETFENIFYISTKYKDYYNNLGKEDLVKMKEITKKATPLYEYRGNTYKRNGGKYSLSRLALAIIKEYVAKQHSNLDTILKELDKVCATYHKIPLIIETKDIKKPEYVDEENGKSLYFIEKDDILKMNNKEYALYAYWDNSEIQTLIQHTKGFVKVNEVL